MTSTSTEITSPTSKSRQPKPQHQQKEPSSILERCHPYLELTRVHKPIGVANFYFPGLFGTLLAATISPAPVPLVVVAKTNAIFLLLAFMSRSALCTWNDILDADLDAQVTRTCMRPLPRGAVTKIHATAFFIVQMAACAIIFKLLPPLCGWYTLPFAALHLIYPYAKRVTNYPQLVLGVAKAGGTVLGFPAMAVSLERTSIDAVMVALGSLCLTVVAWVTLWDTIYSAQDLADDKKAGIKSTMVAHEKHARSFLRSVALVQGLALVAVGIALNVIAGLAGQVFIAGLVLTVVPVLGVMVERVDFQDSQSCVWWFSKGNLGVGVAIAGTLSGSYCVRLL